MDMTSRMTSHFRDAMATYEQSMNVLAEPLAIAVDVLFGALAGMFALIIKLAPWLLLVLAVCWLLSNRRKQSNTYR